MTIGLFAPLPLAMMIPFMAGQSLMMGEAFGKGFQYGKRKISSMSNEEFNALTPDDLGKSIQTDYNAIIPHLGQAVKASSEFQSLVIREIIDVIKKLPSDIIGGFTGTSDPNTQTSTSFIRFGAGVTTGTGPLGGPTIGADTIDKLARQYMEQTGLADFERAKIKIKELIDKNELDRIGALARAARIKAENVAGFTKPTGPVNIRAVRTTGQNVQAIREASASNKARIIETIKNLGPLIQNKKTELLNLKKFKPVFVTPRRLNQSQSASSRSIQINRARASFGTRIAKYNRGLKILQNQLLDLLKKLSNARIQLSNFR